MNIWHDINPSRISSSTFDAVVEIPRGGKLKYELDKETGLLILDRVLHTSTHYPANYGFIPLTLAEDGDPLDVLILSDQAFHSLALIPCHPIGLIRMTDHNESDEKIIAVARNDPNYNGFRSIRELPSHISEEMLHFFSVYKQLEGKETAAEVVLDAPDAVEAVKASITRYEKYYGKEC